jgi:hypothetical protein
MPMPQYLLINLLENTSGEKVTTPPDDQQIFFKERLNAHECKVRN